MNPKKQSKGLLRGAGEKLLGEAMNAAAGYIGNAIQEMMVVKKEVAQPRILPSISNMKVVSKSFIDTRGILQLHAWCR